MAALVRLGAAFAAVDVLRVVVRFALEPFALELLEPLLERRDALLQRVEAAQPPLCLVELLRQRGHAVYERLRAGKVGDPADDLLAAIGETGHEVFSPGPCSSRPWLHHTAVNDPLTVPS